MRERERRMRRLERGIRHLRRRARLLRERLVRIYESVGTDIYVYPPRPPLRRSPPQTFGFCAWYDSSLVSTPCKPEPCSLACDDYSEEPGELYGTEADRDIANWWTTAAQEAWQAYNEWFGDPSQSSTLSSGLRTWFSVLLPYVDGLWHAIEPPGFVSHTVCGDTPHMRLTRGFRYPTDSNPYGLADYRWDGFSMKTSVWLVTRTEAQLHPPWAARQPLNSVGWCWAWRLGTRSYPSWARWKWDSTRKIHHLDAIPVMAEGDVRLMFAVYGRGWAPGAGQSLWDLGARRLIVRWAKSYMQLDGELSTSRFAYPLRRVTWKARYTRGFPVCGSGEVVEDCFEGKVGTCVCMPPGCRSLGMEQPCYVHVYSGGASQVVSFVEHTAEVPTMTESLRELAIVLTGAKVPADKLDDPVAWAYEFMRSLRTDMDYLEVATIGLADWWNGKTRPSSTTYGEFATTDPSVLQWRPSDPSKNALGVLIVPKAALSAYRLTSNPMPTSPPVQWNDQAQVSELAGWCWTGRDLFLWLEDSAGQPIE